MAVSTTTTTTAPTISMAGAPKLKYSSLEEYQKRIAANQTPGKQAAGYFQSMAAGNVSPALSAALSSNREALARAASNVRSTTANTIATSGGIGQGQAVRGTQEAEQSILQSMADSRNKELQLIGQQQQSANETLLNQENAEKSGTLSAIQAGISAGGSLKADALRGLRNYLDSQGVQQSTEESSAAYDQFLADQAENDPSAKMARITAENTLKDEQARQILISSSGSVGTRISKAVRAASSDKAAYDTFMGSIPNATQGDQTYWTTVIMPLINSGNEAAAANAIDKYLVIRNKRTVSVMGRQVPVN